MTIEETRQYFRSFKCEVLTSDENNKSMISEFQSQINNNGLGDYLKNSAWNEDIDGETRVYLVKDQNEHIALFFSLKCGLLLSQSQYDKLEENERSFVDLIVEAKRKNDIEQINGFYEYGSAEFSDIDRLFLIADKRIDSKNEAQELCEGKNTLKVDKCFFWYRVATFL